MSFHLLQNKHITSKILRTMQTINKQMQQFRAPLCPSSGAQEYYTAVAACGISCCGFQVAGLVWS